MQQSAPAYFVLDCSREISRFSGAETGAYLEPSWKGRTHVAALQGAVLLVAGGEQS
jgi:hypothetical protein